MKNPLVVGYKGEIGSFILNGLLKTMPKALNIWCIDVNESKREVNERIKKADVIFLCVPMKDTVKWLRDNKKKLKGKVIIEQTSLKLWRLNVGNEFKDLNIRSMHILYRPSQTPNPEDRKIAFIRGNFAHSTAVAISNMLNSQIVWYMNISEHDDEMALQQALTHRVLLILGEKLKCCRGNTYISQKVIELAERIKRGDLELYKAIQKNPYVSEHSQYFKRDMIYFNIEDYMK